MKRNQLLPATVVVAMVFVFAAPSLASNWDCGQPIPACVDYDLKKRSVEADNNCGHPLGLEVIVEDGHGTGIMTFPNNYGSLMIGPPIDSMSGKKAYYSKISCCLNVAKGYTCTDPMHWRSPDRGE